MFSTASSTPGRSAADPADRMKEILERRHQRGLSTGGVAGAGAVAAAPLSPPSAAAAGGGTGTETPRRTPARGASGVFDKLQSALTGSGAPGSDDGGATPASPLRDAPRIPLLELLRNAAAVGYFLEFMSQHQCADFLNFWLAVEAYRSVDLAAVKRDDLRKDALGLFKTYILNDDGKSPIFKPTDGSVTQLRELFQRESEPKALFDGLFAVQGEVLSMMEKTFYAPFRASTSYQRMYREIWAGTSDPRAGGDTGRSPGPQVPRRPASALEGSTSAPAGPGPAPGADDPAMPATPQARKPLASGVPDGLGTGNAARPPMPPRPATDASTPATTTPGPRASAVPSAALSVAPPASLLEVIKDPTGLFYFCEFMERHRATNLINFWVTVEGYSAAASSAGSSSSSSSSSGSNGVAGGKARTVGSTTDDDTTLRQDTAGLYALYFGPEAAQPIALPKALLAGIRGFIDNQPVNGETMHFEVVLRAQREVLATMERKFFRKFLESSLYNDYRRERAAASSASANEAQLGNPAAPGPAQQMSGKGVATATEMGVQAAAQAMVVAAPGKRSSVVRLGYVDDLGFFVNDSDEDGRHDLYAQQISDGAPKSALSSLLTGGTDAAQEERTARERARIVLADVASAVPAADWTRYDVADSL